MDGRLASRLSLSALAIALALSSCAPRRREPLAGSTSAEDRGPDREPNAQAEPGSTIAWVPYEGAFARAASENKPVVIVMTAGWCEHCRTYQGVLADPEVVALSRRFVMVRVDIDAEPAVNRRHAPDGTYVPRTLFFAPDGTPRPELHATHRERFVHFLNTTDPSELLGLMRRASAG